MTKSKANKYLSNIYSKININNKISDSFLNITEKPDISFRKISEYEIERQMANVNHILFEVTDSCNLRCAYCGYSDLYEDHDLRLNRNFPTESAKIFLNYIITRIRSTDNNSINYNFFISFYGGEPLLNISFIKEIINYVETLNVSNIRFIYGMTTNAVFLNRYMNYLVNKKFQILISLDGNKYNNSYRVNHSNINSFDQVFDNIKQLQKYYPEFFKSNVNINAVLHNRNSVSEIFDFIKQEFCKTPKISELNNMGIKENKKKFFFDLYQNKQNSLSQSDNFDSIREDLFFDSPDTHDLFYFLRNYSGNIFQTYNDLLIDNDSNNRLPTGTCMPFWKKIFITVNGKILPCERIGHQFALGQLTSNSVELDFESIASRYNEWFKKISSQCTQCYIYKSCKQCIFNIEDLDGNPVCKNYMDKEAFVYHINTQMTYLESNPGLYKRIMEELIVE